MRFSLAISGLALVGIVGTLVWAFPAFAMHNNAQWQMLCVHRKWLRRMS